MPPCERLFLSSQSFGFGPTSELIHIAKGLREDSKFQHSEMTIYNTPEVQAILKDTRLQLKVTMRDDGRDVLGFLKRYGPEYNFDGIVSSYDAAPIFYGWFHNIPCFFYDGMLSFWNVDSFKAKIGGNLQALKETKESGDEDSMIQLYRYITGKNHHESIFLAYFLATGNFARGGDKPERQLRHFEELLKKTKIIGALVDPDIPYDASLERDHVLVSLSASLVPTVTFEQNLRFAANTLAFVGSTCQTTPDICWIVSVNPKIFESLRINGFLSRLPVNLVVRESFSTEENLRHIQRAKVLLASPGFSTIHEAAYYRTPVVFLPEQNSGQPVGYTKLKREGYPILPNLTFAENVGGPATVDFDEFSTDALYETTERIYTGAEFKTLRRTVRTTIARLLHDESFNQEVGRNQNEAISRAIGGFRGVQEMVKDIASSCVSRASGFEPETSGGRQKI